MKEDKLYLDKIQEVSQDLYAKNMQYFKTYHSDVFEKIMLLELVIQDQNYTSKYELEFLDDYFDIYDLENSTFMYGENSYSHAHELTKEITFDNKKNNFHAYRYYNFDDEYTEKFSKMDVSLSAHTAYAPLVNYISKNIPEIKRELKTINKFIFLGVGLGLHITDILRKTQVKISLIIEDSLELFRLSLFITNYVELSQQTQLLFSIGENDNAFIDKCGSFLVEQYIYNNNIKFSLFSESHRSKLAQIQSSIVSQSQMTYDYSRHFLRTLRPLEYWTQKFNFLDVSTSFDTTKFVNKPFLVIGAGPSLGRNLKWFKKNHHRFVLVAVYATLPFFYKYKIKPDVVVHIDEDLNDNLPVLSQIDIQFFKDSKFLFSAITHSKILENFDKKNIFLIQAICKHNNDIGQLFAPSVGEIAYAISLLCKSNNIYLLGIDLALDPETNSSHSEFHNEIQVNKDFDETKDKEMEKGSLDATYLQVKGNFRDVVYTTPRYQPSISQINNITQVFKNATQKVYNC